MNKQALLRGIAEVVRKKHPWSISQERYLDLFGKLPQEFLEERIYYDNLVEKSKQFKLCKLPVPDIKIEIKLTLDECITWELSLDKWEEARAHNIFPGDIKKLIREIENG